MNFDQFTSHILILRHPADGDAVSRSRSVPSLQARASRMNVFRIHSKGSNRTSENPCSLRRDADWDSLFEYPHSVAPLPSNRVDESSLAFGRSIKLNDTDSCVLADVAHN